MIPITINGRKHEINTEEPCFIMYGAICELAGYDPKINPTVICRSIGRVDHTLSAGDIGPVEIGAIYNVANTSNA